MAAKKKADAAVENTAEVTQETVQEEIEQVAADNAKELDNKKYVVDHLLSTKREGMEDLIAYMEESDSLKHLAVVEIILRVSLVLFITAEM